MAAASEDSVQARKCRDIDIGLREEVVPHHNNLEPHPERFTPMNIVFDRLDRRMKVLALDGGANEGQSENGPLPD